MEWIKVNERLPEFGVKVKIKKDNGDEGIGFIDDDVNRTCWLIQGTGGAFWRSLIVSITHWQPLV